MTLYLCGMAALDLTRYLRATNAGELPGGTPRPRRLRAALHSNRELNELSYSAQLMLSHVRGRVEALVPNRDGVTRTRKLVTHLWSSDLPRNAFVDLGNGIYLSSPQFLYLQLAAQLNYVELIALGNELCGFYSKWRLPSSLAPSTHTSGHNGTTYDILPATSMQKLTAFARASKARGSRPAQRALRMVLNNAASPAETAVYLLLCLPRHLGGYGLPKPVFNAKVGVTTSITHEERYPDLYWPSRGLDVEYQSDYAHTGNWKRYRDSRREIELEAERVTVLPLTRPQLMDVDAFDAFATTVRRLLGRRTRSFPDDWASKRDELRAMLLSGAQE